MSATYKTNYDVAVFTESGEAGIGVEVRDARGEVIAALSKKNHLPGLSGTAGGISCKKSCKIYY